MSTSPPTAAELAGRVIQAEAALSTLATRADATRTGSAAHQEALSAYDAAFGQFLAALGALQAMAERAP